MTMSNKGNELQLKVSKCFGVYEVVDNNGLIMGFHRDLSKAIQDFINRWEERFNETPKYKWS
jgi:hypothetical protein